MTGPDKMGIPSRRGFPENADEASGAILVSGLIDKAHDPIRNLKCVLPLSIVEPSGYDGAWRKVILLDGPCSHPLAGLTGPTCRWEWLGRCSPPLVKSYWEEPSAEPCGEAVLTAEGKFSFIGLFLHSYKNSTVLP